MISPTQIPFLLESLTSTSSGEGKKTFLTCIQNRMKAGLPTHPPGSPHNGQIDGQPRKESASSVTLDVAKHKSLRSYSTLSEMTKACHAKAWPPRVRTAADTSRHLLVDGVNDIWFGALPSHVNDYVSL